MHRKPCGSRVAAQAHRGPARRRDPKNGASGPGRTDTACALNAFPLPVGVQTLERWRTRLDSNQRGAAARPLKRRLPSIAWLLVRCETGGHGGTRTHVEALHAPAGLKARADRCSGHVSGAAFAAVAHDCSPRHAAARPLALVLPGGFEPPSSGYRPLSLPLRYRSVDTGCDGSPAGIEPPQ